MESSFGEKKHVLLVDDEKSLTQTLSMLLGTRGYDVDVAHCGKDALRFVSTNVDLILLDVVLPDFDGFEVCRRLKQAEKTQHIPIIMLSAHALSENKIEGLYLGADDFLSKPCGHEELFARMEVVLRRSAAPATAMQEREKNNVICELRRILDEGLVVPFYQPIYQLDPFALYGVEVLTRPLSQGILADPEKFFKASLQYGLYTDMEMLAWSLALRRLSVMLNDEKIFLNCNPYFIESSQFLRVKSIFEQNQIPASNVFLEITERTAIANFELFFERLRDYRDYGFRFAVDDVGGGYSSLETIVETKPEVVKIDRHIVRNVCQDSYKRSIIKFIVSFCNENGLISIAEGIEDRASLELVRELGVHAGQGYYLCRPTANADLAGFRKIILD